MDITLHQNQESSLCKLMLICWLSSLCYTILWCAQWGVSVCIIQHTLSSYQSACWMYRRSFNPMPNSESNGIIHILQQPGNQWVHHLKQHRHQICCRTKKLCFSSLVKLVPRPTKSTSLDSSFGNNHCHHKLSNIKGVNNQLSQPNSSCSLKGHQVAATGRNQN